MWPRLPQATKSGTSPSTRPRSISRGPTAPPPEPEPNYAHLGRLPRFPCARRAGGRIAAPSGGSRGRSHLCSFRRSGRDGSSAGRFPPECTLPSVSTERSPQRTPTETAGRPVLDQDPSDEGASRGHERLWGWRVWAARVAVGHSYRCEFLIFEKLRPRAWGGGGSTIVCGKS